MKRDDLPRLSETLSQFAGLKSTQAPGLTVILELVWDEAWRQRMEQYRAITSVTVDRCPYYWKNHDCQCVLMVGHTGPCGYPLAPPKGETP